MQAFFYLFGTMYMALLIDNVELEWLTNKKNCWMRGEVKDCPGSEFVHSTTLEDF